MRMRRKEGQTVWDCDKDCVTTDHIKRLCFLKIENLFEVASTLKSNDRRSAA